jgi:hypothetical protein
LVVAALLRHRYLIGPCFRTRAKLPDRQGHFTTILSNTSDVPIDRPTFTSLKDCSGKGIVARPVRASANLAASLINEHLVVGAVLLDMCGREVAELVRDQRIALT